MAEFISLGAGVQSSTMALMAKEGLLEPMPAGAIFADTQWEPESVYSWLAWLETQLPFPVYRVSYGDLGLEMLKVRKRKRDGSIYIRSIVPAYTLEPNGNKGILQRRCTRDFKVFMIERQLRKLTKKQPTVSWIGISIDEAARMKPSRLPWVQIRHPLIEKLISRKDCLEWMAFRGYPQPPRSACIFCPYHSDAEWRRLRDEEPVEFQRAVDLERKYQEVMKLDEITRAVPYFHGSCVPLDQVDFDDRNQLRLFNNECEGMCGV